MSKEDFIKLWSKEFGVTAAQVKAELKRFPQVVEKAVDGERASA